MWGQSQCLFCLCFVIDHLPKFKPMRKESQNLHWALLCCLVLLLVLVLVLHQLL